MQERKTPRVAQRYKIDLDRIGAEIVGDGYVSGVLGGSFVDKATGARDLGFGLDIVDFLLEPAPEGPTPAGQYDFGNLVHGDIRKRYVEGPQICTQAKHLPITRSEPADGVLAFQTRYRWTDAYPPYERAGSVWEQTIVFHKDWRFFLSADRVTTVSESPCLFLRVDMPGHIKHREGMDFEHVYLSYNDPKVIPSTEFVEDFAPDARFLYRRGVTPRPERFIRGYQVNRDPAKEGEGPWLVGMTLNPDDVYQAWCPPRGYFCRIEELGGRPTKPGDTFGACYLVGWFDDLDAMDEAYDRFRGWSGIELGGPEGFRGLKQEELTPVRMPDDGDAAPSR
jgi:hypothetical protein